MIYNQNRRFFQWTEFAFDIDEKFYSYFPANWLHTAGAEAWLRHNERRIYLRLYVFVDSVLERYNNGQLGFKDPVIVWSNLKDKEFAVHPGKNRIILKMLLPEVRMVGWIMDNSGVRSRHEYEGIFNNKNNPAEKTTTSGAQDLDTKNELDALKEEMQQALKG